MFGQKKLYKYVFQWLCLIGLRENVAQLIDGSTARRYIAIVTNERHASYVIPLNSS